MYARIVLTAGISVFNPHNSFGKQARESSTDLVRFNGTNPEPANPTADPEEIAEEWIRRIGRKDWQIPAGEEKKVSAEFSMLWALRGQRELKNDSDIVLIHSDSFGGIAASGFLEKILPPAFHCRVKPRKIADLDAADRNLLTASLGRFMQVIGNELSAGEPTSTFFAPIGGYKFMSAYGYLAGSFYNYPTGYMHEDKQVLQLIPPAPITVNDCLIRENAGFLRTIKLRGLMEEKELDMASLEFARGRGAFLFERSDGMIGLNAFGQFLLESAPFAGFFGWKYLLGSQPSSLLKGSRDTASFVADELASLLQKTETPEREAASSRLVHHERDAWPGLKGKTLHWHLFKGSSHPRVFRCLWRNDRETMTLKIRHIWTNHDYTKEIERNPDLLGRADNPGESDLTETIRLSD